jgi:hypothetical protein
MLAGQNNILNMIVLARGIVEMIHELNQQASIFFDRVKLDVAANTGNR